MRHSLYWDDFDRRIDETVCAVKTKTIPPVRRVAVFVTDRCNLKCAYCNSIRCGNEMNEETFDGIVKSHPQALVHITGGEPSVVKWLYPYLSANSSDCVFHLNTNAVITPPSEHVKRLKVSLDSYNKTYWDELVGVRGTFDKVVKNVKDACSKTVTSITYTLTHENFRDSVKFAEFAKNQFPGLYAVFFSVYKGNNERFALSDNDVSEFFSDTKQKLLDSLDDESAKLLSETIDEKVRLMSGTRFSANERGVCYISLSERVYKWDGTVSACSHLYRDGIMNKPGEKHEKCKYGCNQRLVMFNDEVHERVHKKKLNVMQNLSACDIMQT